MYAAAREDTKGMDHFVKVNYFMHVKYVEDLTPYNDTGLIFTIPL